MKLGLNEIHDIKLVVSHPDSYHDQARKKAVEDAIMQAESLTKDFKIRLGPVYSLRYHSNDNQQIPVSLMMAQSRRGSNDEINETYSAEMIYFNDQVEVVFYLQTKPSR